MFDFKGIDSNDSRPLHFIAGCFAKTFEKDVPLFQYAGRF